MPGHTADLLNLLSNGTPRSVYAKLLPRQSVPSLYWCLGLCIPWYRTFHLLSLIFMEAQLAHFSGLLRFPWRVALLSIILTVPSKVVSSVDLLKVHSLPSSWSLKTLQNIGPSIDPWWMSLVTGHQLDFPPNSATLWVRQSSQFSTHFLTHICSPYLTNLTKRRLWQSVSKTMLKPRHTTSTVFPLSTAPW